MQGGYELADDFNRTEELIGAAYTSMIEPSGLLRYGMFLMLTRTEFVRFERGRHPFCIATIGLHPANGAQLSNAALGKIGELFESGCQPLDVISYAGGSRFFALFPQAGGAPTANVLRNFLNRVASTQLDNTTHGGTLFSTVGLAEVPRDGMEFQRIFDIACRLRRQATPQERLVMSGN
jgi:hypothetical protein